MKLKKDGTPAKKPGRKPDPNKPPKVPGPGRKAPRPHVWVSGPDEYRHTMYMPWLKAKAQANFRGETWKLTFDEFYSLWKDDWSKRGRKAEDMCMTRNDPNGAWDYKNTLIITRHEHLKRQGEMRKLYEESNFYKLYKSRKA